MVDLAGEGSGRACARACPRVDVWRWKLVSILLSSPLQLLCGRSCRQSDRDWERSLRQNTDVVRGGTPARPCRFRPAPPFTRKPSKTSVVLLVTETSRDVILCLNIIKLGNVALLWPSAGFCPHSGHRSAFSWVPMFRRAFDGTSQATK